MNRIFLSNPKDWYIINALCALYIICALRSISSRVSVHTPSLRIDEIQAYGLMRYRLRRMRYKAIALMKKERDHLFVVVFILNER